MVKEAMEKGGDGKVRQIIKPVYQKKLNSLVVPGASVKFGLQVANPLTHRVSSFEIGDDVIKTIQDTVFH